jgi:hypothetical protein
MYFTQLYNSIIFSLYEINSDLTDLLNEYGGFDDFPVNK